jgi:CBS domain-containing protein
MVVYALALDKDPKQTCVGDIMNAQVYSCYEDDTLEHAADILAEQEVRRLVVLSRQETLVGVVSMADMIKCTSHDAVNDNVVHHLFRYA